MTPSRIAITGVGMVTALGQSAPTTFAALLRGDRGLAPLSLFDVGDVRSKLVGQVAALRVSDVAPSGKEWSRTDAMAVAAALEARAHAGLTELGRVGVALGGTTGGMFETEALLSRPELASLGLDQAAELVSFPLSASLARVAEALGGAALTRSVCSACSGGAIALVQAAAWLQRGEVDVAFAGGADGLCRMTVLGFNALGATDPGACRPFDVARAGLNLGEGAALLALEREETALARGAPVLAWLDGFAVGAEAHHITHPEPSGVRASQLLRAALARAGLVPADVGYVNAHGTGTRQNDAMEAQAVLDVLGAAAQTTRVSSSKAQLGHTLGASGAVEAAITALSVAGGRVPPTAGLERPELPGLRHVLGRGEQLALQAALTSSFGFGGMSCVLALTHRDRPSAVPARSSARIVISAPVAFGAGAEPDRELHPERSRRFDRGSALAAVAAARLPPHHSATGLVLGSAFGNVERTMAFLARASERGPRQVPPAEFPHLVPSAPAGNASVYGGLTGPVFAVGQLALSGEAAFSAGCDLLELGVAERVLVGAIAPRDAIVERVLAPMLEANDHGERGEGAGFVLLETEPSAAAGVALRFRRMDADVVRAVPPPPASGRALVVLGALEAGFDAALAASPWAGVERRALVPEHGFHEALGAVALAEAARLLLDPAEPFETVLVLSGGTAHGSAALLERR